MTLNTRRRLVDAHCLHEPMPTIIGLDPSPGFCSRNIPADDLGGSTVIASRSVPSRLSTKYRCYRARDVPALVV